MVQAHLGIKQDPISKITNMVGHQWLTAVILATREAEIRGLWFEAISGK
jgi:hypothetical protein